MNENATIIDVHPVKTPILTENLIYRLKAYGGAVFVDPETGQEIDEMELFKKNRPADDETRRTKSMRDINFTRLEIEMIPISLPIDVKSYQGSPEGGMQVGEVVATSDSHKNWPELMEYILKSIMFDVEMSNLSTYKGLASTLDKENIKFGITEKGEDTWIMKLVDARTSGEFVYSEQFVKIIGTPIIPVLSADTALHNLNPIVSEASINNYDHEEDKAFDLDIPLRVQVHADVQMVIGSGRKA